MKSQVFAVLLILITGSSVQLSPQSPSGRPGIEGVVVSVESRQPIAGAKIELWSGNNAVPTAQSSPSFRRTAPGESPIQATPRASRSRRSTETKADGSFAFENLADGTYRIVVDADGYSRREFGQLAPNESGSVIQIIGGKTVRGLVINLPRTSIVRGRVTNNDGNSVQVSVYLLKAEYDPEGRRSTQKIQATSTDDRGEYRFSDIASGNYYVAAISPTSASADGDDTTAFTPGRYALTYYPGVSDPGDAAVFEIKPGVEMVLPIKILPRQRPLRIRGRLVDVNTGRWPASASIQFSYSLPSGSYAGSGSGQYYAVDGTFEINNLDPGFYAITATNKKSSQTSATPDTRNSTGSTSADSSFTAYRLINLTNSDVDGVELVQPNAISLEALVRVDNRLSVGPSASVPPVRIELWPTSFANNQYLLPPFRARPASADGRVQLPATEKLFAGEYRLSALSLPEGYYVKEVRLNGVDVQNRAMQFSPFVPSRLDIVLSPNGGRMDGLVRNEKLGVTPNAVVVLIPEGKSDQLIRYKTARTDSMGRYVIRGVAPGNYKLFAWDSIPEYAYFSKEIQNRFDRYGTSVTVSENNFIHSDIQVIRFEQ